MSASEVIQRWVDAVNRKDAAHFAELYAPDATVHDPQYDAPLEGRDAVRRDMEAFLRTFPDLRVTLRTSVVAGNRYAVEATFDATQQGPLALPDGELPPTGRRVHFDAAGFCRLDGRGRILEEHRYLDFSAVAAGLQGEV